MSRLRRVPRLAGVLTVVALALPLLFPAASTGAGAKKYTWAGQWSSFWGNMKLEQNGSAVKGTYPFCKGHVEGTASGRKLTGRWSQEDFPCGGTADKGGPIEWTLDETGQKYTGRWRYDNRTQWRTDWTGKCFAGPCLPQTCTVGLRIPPGNGKAAGVEIGTRVALDAPITGTCKLRGEGGDLTCEIRGVKERKNGTMPTFNNPDTTVSKTSKPCSQRVYSRTPAHWDFKAFLTGPDGVEASSGVVTVVWHSGWEGKWGTTYGVMHLDQDGTRVTGTYGGKRGRIKGTATGRFMKGTWSQGDGVPPSNAGDIEFELIPPNKFKGRWRYGSTGPWSTTPWTGDRQ